MIIALSLAALLTQLPQQGKEAFAPPAQPQIVEVEVSTMTSEDLQKYPGRERFDKTEWYEAQLKSMQTIVIPEHVDEWNNGGLDIAAL